MMLLKKRRNGKQMILHLPVIPSCEIALLNLPKPLHHALPLHGPVGRSGNDSSFGKIYGKCGL